MDGRPFDDLPRRPTEHFNLYFYAAAWNLIEQTAQALGSHKAAFAQFPFLAGYHAELNKRGVDRLTWEHAIADWEKSAVERLPLLELRQAADLDHTALILLMSVGMIEEDARFGPLFESIHGIAGERRPTVGLLNAWWREAITGDVRSILHRLQDLGLVQVVNLGAPRAEWALQSPGVLWDALRGRTSPHPAAWVEYREPLQLAAFEDLILPGPLRESLALVPSLLERGDVQALIIRGPQHNGRRTLAGAIARRLGRGILTTDALGKADDERWKLLGPLCTLLRAMPVLVFDLAPSECAGLPGLPGYNGPVAIMLGKHGGVTGPGAERALTVALPMPAAQARRRHWQAALGPAPDTLFDALSERFRMTGGNIRCVAVLARAHAALERRAEITLGDAQTAGRASNRQTLDTLAARVDVSGSWGQLAVASHTLAELCSLESRCRHRDRLPASVGSALGAQLNCGVRALFTGPSGTGKTLAARLLASVLQMDLYRLDLSSLVNKYIGETEKNLNRLFARAEELDVILLLDEGDALLTQRTSVHNSNDRYANLETNYLLQRLESYEGILIVTSNASDRIDKAFQRRMDVVIDFRPPEAAERWAIWQLHLPSTPRLDAGLLEEIAGRCALSGGQIRNAAVHASLLALGDAGWVTASHLEAAVQREYRKIGAVCPLRRTAAAARMT